MVFITSIGIVSAIGNNVYETHQSLIKKKTGIVKDNGIYKGIFPLTNKEISEKLQIKDTLSRTTLLANLALNEALENLNFTANLRKGIVSSTSVGGMDLSENEYFKYIQQKEVNYSIFKNHSTGFTAEYLAQKTQFNDFVNTISTACSSSANAIIMGANLIKSNMLDMVAVGGTDALSNFTLKGFQSLMIYDSDFCKPFDESRKGLNLGEGSAFLILESEKSIQKTKNIPLAKISGYANTSDAYHQTASSPNGYGATLAMTKAIKNAKINAYDINFINAHGTGTKNNDASESVAIKNVFETVPLFNSTKQYTGHTLGAAGAIESVFSILNIVNQEVYPTIDFENPISETGLVPLQVYKELKINHVLSNSFGFGGNNSSLIFTSI